MTSNPLPQWTPDLVSLELLMAVGELGSVGRAAARLGVTQPSASARLARLERQVGARLVDRDTRGSRLTPTGEALIAWARPVLAAAAELAGGIATLRARRTARLRVAASLTVAEYLVPTWLLLLRRAHPDIETAVQVVNSHSVIELVRQDRVDLGFVESPGRPNGVRTREVGRDRVTLVVAAGYPLAARAGQQLTPADVLDQPLLLREPGSGTRETFLAALGLGSAAPPRAVELGSTATIIATALAGGGIGIVSARAVAAQLVAGTLVELSLAGVRLNRPLRAVWAGRAPSALAGELVDIARAAPA